MGTVRYYSTTLLVAVVLATFGLWLMARGTPAGAFSLGLAGVVAVLGWTNYVSERSGADREALDRS